MKLNRHRKILFHEFRYLSISMFMFISANMDIGGLREVNSTVNLIAYRLKYTRNEDIYYHAHTHALSTDYFIIFIIWINVLHCYKTNMRD